MCGIFGFLGPTAHMPSPERARDALDLIAHRGPDASGLLRLDDEGLVFGHRRLSIIDPVARSDQPFVRGETVMTYNGEIYNFRELRRELETLGARFETNGDTEVLAAGYAHWGTEVFARIEGMHAVAIFDRRDRMLHLARDAFGIKPLVYTTGEAGFYFASEIKPLARFNRFALDPEVLADIFVWGFQTQNRSICRGVEYLAPGTVLSVSMRAGRPEILAREPARPGGHRPSAAPGRPDLRTVVDASVADHTVADVPVAVALSGGLDSSIVAASAAQHNPSLDAFTYSFNAGIDAEVEHAGLLCAKKHIAHHVHSHRSLHADLLRDITYFLEEPIANANVIPSFLLARSLRDANYKVVMVGEGADEIFAGYPWHVFALESEGLSAEYIFDAYRKRRGQLGSLRYLTPDFRDRVEDLAGRQRTDFARRLKANGSNFRGFLDYDRATQLQFSQLLRVDRMFMAFGVEARVPFLYDSVLQASRTLPETQMASKTLVNGRTSKIALAGAYADMLPEAIVTRPKFGTKGTVNLWDTIVADLVNTAFDAFAKGHLRREAKELLAPYVDWSAVLASKLAPKERFALLLLLESVHLLVVENGGKRPPTRAMESA